MDALACQRFARDDASVCHACLCVAAWAEPVDLRERGGTDSEAQGFEVAARAWHARGQGFKSPQLHPRSQALSAVDRLRIARLGQQIGSNLYRHGPIRSSGAAGRGRVPSCPRPVDPGRTGPAAGRSFATKDRIGWAITDCPGGYCADRGLRRSRPTVGAEGMRSSIVVFTRTDQHTFAQ